MKDLGYTHFDYNEYIKWATNNENQKQRKEIQEFHKNTPIIRWNK
jgi:hypothetical protein